MTTTLDFILAHHGSPDNVVVSVDPILFRVVISGEVTPELQKDLAEHFRNSKPGYTVMFDRDLLAEIRTKRKADPCLSY